MATLSAYHLYIALFKSSGLEEESFAKLLGITTKTLGRWKANSQKSANPYSKRHRPNYLCIDKLISECVKSVYGNNQRLFVEAFLKAVHNFDFDISELQKEYLQKYSNDIESGLHFVEDIIDRAIIAPLDDKKKPVSVKLAIQTYDDSITGQRYVAFQDELREMTELMLYQGISGSMGRQNLFRLANQGNRIACFELGELFYYHSGSGISDYAKAKYWYEKAGDHPGAVWTLGYMIITNKCPQVDPDKIDYLKALDYFNRAGEKSAPALTSIGQLWDEGHYPKADGTFENADNNKAVEYYRMAAEMQYHFAMNRLALYYEHNGNASEAYRWLEKSNQIAADGWTLNKLGYYAEHGIGCERNLDVAAEFYLRAITEPPSETIAPWAQFNAARVYSGQLQKSREQYYDLRKAWELFVNAIKNFKSVQEHPMVLNEMLSVLSECYDEKNNEEAHALFEQTRVLIMAYMRKIRGTPAEKSRETSNLLAFFKEVDTAFSIWS